MTDKHEPVKAQEWSKHYPSIRLVHSPHSLDVMMRCWREYELRYVEGWRTQADNVDLEFGWLVEHALVAGKKARLAGGSVEEAQRASLRFALDHSGEWVPGANPEDGEEAALTWHHWRGAYAQMWKCSGTVKGKGTPAEHLGKKKCPHAYAAFWSLMTPAPTECHICSSPIVSEERWLPEDKVKNLPNLLRTVVWYWEEFGEEDGWELLSFPDGTEGIELPFLIPITETEEEEVHWLRGIFDELGQFGIEPMILERKTTKQGLGSRYFDGFAINIQVDAYDLVGSLQFPELGAMGVLLEAIGLIQDGPRFARVELHRTEAQREELWWELGEYWLPELERHGKARDQDGTPFPMNRSGCWRCDFRGVCSKPPGEARSNALKANFERRKRDE